MDPAHATIDSVEAHLAEGSHLIVDPAAYDQVVDWLDSEDEELSALAAAATARDARHQGTCP